MQARATRCALAGAWVAWVVCTSAAAAVAQEGDAGARAAAQSAFREARAMMEAGNFAEACPKLEDSLSLYPALGVRLNLALCYERTQRPASAWYQYRAVAEQDGPTRRAKIARQSADALEPHLPRLIVRAPANPPSGFEVTRDGAPVEPALLGTAVYVDPGEHAVRATAPGHRPFERRVRVDMDQQVEIEVPPLAPEPAPVAAVAGEPTPATPEPAGAPAGGAGEDPRPRAAGPAVSEQPRARAPAGGPGSRRTLAWITGGGGAVLLAAGLGFGLAARSAWDDAREIGLCDRDTLECGDPRGPGMVETARTRARVSNVTAGAGAALLVTGAVLYWMSRDGGGDGERSARVLPTAGAGGFGLALSGEF